MEAEAAGGAAALGASPSLERPDGVGPRRASAGPSGRVPPRRKWGFASAVAGPAAGEADAEAEGVAGESKAHSDRLFGRPSLGPPPLPPPRRRWNFDADAPVVVIARGAGNAAAAGVSGGEAGADVDAGYDDRALGDAGASDDCGDVVSAAPRARGDGARLRGLRGQVVDGAGGAPRRGKRQFGQREVCRDSIGDVSNVDVFIDGSLDEMAAAVGVDPCVLDTAAAGVIPPVALPGHEEGSGASRMRAAEALMQYRSKAVAHRFALIDESRSALAAAVGQSGYVAAAPAVVDGEGGSSMLGGLSNFVARASRKVSSRVMAMASASAYSNFEEDASAVGRGGSAVGAGDGDGHADATTRSGDASRMAAAGSRAPG